jgi:aminodeoxyfutalosine synthase
MIANADSVEALIHNLNIDVSLKKIAEKVLNNERITFDEGVLLYEKGDLGFVGTLANYIRNKKHGEAGNIQSMIF